MDDLTLPAFYVVNRRLPREHASFIAAALKITPINIAIVSDVADVSLALEFCSSILRVADNELAMKTAMSISQTARPLVIGDADVLDAVYPDGKTEPVATSC
jgi:hypothetical protein